MKNFLIATVGALALAGFAVPTMAHPVSNHRAQHDQIDQQHADVHDQIDQTHQDAHDQLLKRPGGGENPPSLRPRSPVSAKQSQSK